MAQLESTFGFNCEVNNTNLHIKIERDNTSDDNDETNVKLSNKNYENNVSELKPKKEVDDKMEHIFVNICDKKFTVKEELLDVTEQQQETDRTQDLLESTHKFKHYGVNTDLQRESLINKYEDSVLRDVKIKTELLDIKEQPEEADWQVPKSITIIKENESDEEGTMDDVSKAINTSGDEDPAVHKDRGSFGEATNNEVSNLNAQSVKTKKIGTHPTIKKGTLTNSKNLNADRACNKFIYSGNEKSVNAGTSSVNSGIDYIHYDAETSKNIFICDLCNNSYQNKISLNQHIQRHLNLFNCTYCSYTANNKGNINRHINTKHTKNTVYNCSYCSYTTHIKCNLNRHINTKHTKNIVHNCSYCSYSTYDSSTLSSHVNFKHTKNTVYNCSYCSYKTCVRSTLSSHVNIKHTMKTVYNCSYCSYSTYNRSTFSRHMKVKHSKNTVHNCSSCNYRTYDRSSLSSHVNSKHTKETVYNCSYCDYKSFHKGGLNRHINALHTKTNVFNCSHCDHKTYHKNTLARHIKAKHNN